MTTIPADLGTKRGRVQRIVGLLRGRRTRLSERNVMIGSVSRPAAPRGANEGPRAYDIAGRESGVPGGVGVFVEQLAECVKAGRVDAEDAALVRRAYEFSRLSYRSEEDVPTLFRP